MNTELKPLIMLARLQEAFEGIEFSRTQALKILHVGKERFNELVNDNKIRVRNEGVADNSIWYCNGYDIINLVMNGEQKKSCKITAGK